MDGRASVVVHPCPYRSFAGRQAPRQRRTLRSHTVTQRPHRTGGSYPRTPARGLPLDMQKQGGQIIHRENCDGPAGVFFPSPPQSQFCGGTDPASALGNCRANGFVQTIP